jgi:RNA polymerase sigma-70 factor (ECF subfamily)
LFIFSENKIAVQREKSESCMYDLELNIIKRIKSGDVNSFEQIVEKYKDKALTLSMRILKNKEDAEDSLQEAFIKTFRAIAENQFEERAKFSTYFYRIVYNTAIDNYKKLKSKTYNLLRIDESSSSQSDAETGDITNFEMKVDAVKYDLGSGYRTDKKALDNEVQVFVNRYLAEIPEKYSVILTLFFLNDLSHEEISEMLNLPLGTVKNRIFRAKDKLKDIMMKNYPVEEILQFI